MCNVNEEFKKKKERGGNMVLQLQMVKEMKGMAGPNLLTNENAVLAKEKLCRQESTTQWKKWI